MIVTVVYGRVVDMDRARQCPRCRGEGRERSNRRHRCVRCGGSGVKPEGWAYHVEALTLALGDVVACPPTPYSHGVEVLATVVDLDSPPPPGNRPLKTITRRASWQENNS
jgi:hypothetical protein